MKVAVELNVADYSFPLIEMGDNGVGVGIVTQSPDWSAPDVGMPVFHVHDDLYYFPHDESWVSGDDAGKFHVRPLRHGERIVFEN